MLCRYAILLYGLLIFYETSASRKPRSLPEQNERVTSEHYGSDL